MKKTDKPRVNEKLIAGIAAFAVVSICAAVYFGVNKDHGINYDVSPEGVSFASPDSSDGSVQIEDEPVPLADSFEEIDELSDFDVLDEEQSGRSGDEEVLSDELITEDSDSGNKGDDELIVEDLDETSGGSDKDNGSDKGTASPSESQSVAELDKMMLKKINDLRASVGAGKLNIDNTLSKYAAIRAKEASVNWSHTRPDGTQGCDMIPSGKYRAENLSCRIYSSFGYTQKEQESAADAMFDNLKGSPAHYDNMIYKKFTKIGISTYVTKSSSGKIQLTTAYMFSN